MTEKTLPSLMECLQDPEEGPLLRRLLTRPGDDDARRTYVELLVRRGDRRAALLSMNAASSEERAAVMAAVAAEPGATWWRAVRSHAWTLNCGLPTATSRVRFATECTRDWSTLTPTSRAGVRHCDECLQPVYECPTRADAEGRARLGDCVAIPAALAAELGTSLTATIMGRPHVPTLWASAAVADRPEVPAGILWALRVRAGDVAWEPGTEALGSRRFAGGVELIETGRTRWIFAEGTEATLDLGPVPDNLTVRLVDGRKLSVRGGGPGFEPTRPFERPDVPWAALREALVADGLAGGEPRSLPLSDVDAAHVSVDASGWRVDVVRAGAPRLARSWLRRLGGWLRPRTGH
ncbi:MAG: hypothetical protein IV100_13115 [Myxococcales bacterium]|nr:hypothetical protein [Myxococcales bacterium]